MYKNVIAIFFLLCEIVSADCLLYESEAFAIEAADEYRRSCESYGGGGGVFSSSVSESSPNNTCGGYYAENAYVLRVSCNTCGSVTMQEELDANKEYCNALCKVAALSCVTPLNSWGSVLSGEATACGNDDASLPGCSESSSSFGASSSSEFSSSSEISSSSEANFSSSSSEIKSSSSEALSSSIGENPFGYTEGLHLCPTDVTYFNMSSNYCNEAGGCKCYHSNTSRIKLMPKTQISMRSVNSNNKLNNPIELLNCNNTEKKVIFENNLLKLNQNTNLNYDLKRILDYNDVKSI